LRGIQAVNLPNQFDYTRHRIQFVLANLLIAVALVATRAVERVSTKAALVDDLNGRMDPGPDLQRRDALFIRTLGEPGRAPSQMDLFRFGQFAGSRLNSLRGFSAGFVGDYSDPTSPNRCWRSAGTRVRT